LSASGLTAAARIRAAVGCDLLFETFPAVMARGAGLPAPVKIPYFPDHAVAVLKPYDQILLAGARAPVAFFGYEGLPGRLLGEEQRRLRLDGEGQDAAAARVAPHTYVTITGGAIGQGLPCATGAALASPGPRLIEMVL
jgi:acetolactate synthase-1/2/3 large subunit